jgi:hypothetical protein
MLLWKALLYIPLELVGKTSRREGLWLWGHVLLWHIAIRIIGLIKSGVHGWR